MIQKNVLTKVLFVIGLLICSITALESILEFESSQNLKPSKFMDVDSIIIDNNEHVENGSAITVDFKSKFKNVVEESYVFNGQ